MNTNVNLAAPLGALGLLGAGGALLGAALLVLCLWLLGRRAAAGRVGLCAVGLGVVYVGLLLLFALASRERVLARGAEKYFCELDCHLAYAVTDVRTAQLLGPAQAQVQARGRFYIVTVRTRFDEQTIAPQRDAGLLWPNPRAVVVYDAQGRKYDVSPAGQRALAAAEGLGTPFTTPLRPGESYVTRLVFDLPPAAPAPRLLVHEADAITQFIIGHENSPLHGQTMFQLDDAAAQAAAAN